MAGFRFGKYLVGSRLARGGMAEIYLATALGPEGFRKPVVLKRLYPHLAERPELVEMFLEEARLAAQLQHPNLVQVHELGREGNDYYQCLEYLAGEDLASVVARAKERAQPIPPEVVAYLGARAADGLHYAHRMRGLDGQERRLVHGDISPSNLMVTFQGEVKVIDFGIARLAGPEEAGAPGGVKGKLAYLAPEQLLGQPVDGRTDVFALGVVLHELLTGERLFRRDTDEATRQALLNQPIPDPRRLRPDVPEALARVVMQALARKPGERLATADALRARLENFLAGGGSLVSPATLGAWLRSLFGAAHVRARHATVQEVTGSLTGTLPGEPPEEVPSGSLSAIPLVLVREPRGRQGFVRVAAEVPAALLRAGSTMVAVPAHLASYAMQWTRGRVALTSLAVFVLAFAAGIWWRELGELGGMALLTPAEPEAALALASAAVLPTPPALARPSAPPPEAPPRESGILEVAGKGGEVLVGGSRVGKVPLWRRMPAGTYDVAVVGPGEDWVWTAVVRPGKKTRLVARK